MSSRDLSLKLTLQAIDKMSGPLARALSTTTAETAKANKAQRADFQRLSQAREMLGIRSEHAIQREIQRTEGAYRRLAASGTLSWREQSRAADVMRKQITALTNEMGKLTKAQRAAGFGRNIVAAGVGATAAGYVLKPAVEKAMSYDLRLAHMANTAFSDRNTAGRKSGARDLDRAIVDSIRNGGGTRDQAAGTLEALIASGAMNVGDASGLLPTLMKSATASGADPNELANIAIRGMQTFKIKPQELPNIIDMAVAAGQAGGFDLKDMAKWLPQQMAAASASGLSGTGGFAKLAALNQAAVITAGSKDEAGNNLVNLLTKINAPDTAQDAKKLGINLPKYLTEQRANGVDSIDAFVGLVDQTVSKQAAWKQLQAKLKSAKDDTEKRDTLESMASIVQGSGVGKLVQDRQALMALVAIMNNREYLNDVEAKTRNSAGASDRNFEVISDTPSFKTSQVGNEKEISLQQVMDGLTPSIGTLADKTVELAREYPALTTATVAATAALAALAAAGGGAALVNIFTDKKPGQPGGLPGSVKNALGPTVGFALKRILPLWAAWEGGQWAGGHINDGINWGLSKVNGQDTSLGAMIYDMTHRNEQKVDGEIRIRVDQDGRVSSVTGSSLNAGVPFSVDAGYTMYAP